MAQFTTRPRKGLPTVPVFIGGYDQGMIDMSTSILTYFEQKYVTDEGKPMKGTPEQAYFLDGIRELSRHIKETRKKAEERAKSAN